MEWAIHLGLGCAGFALVWGLGSAPVPHEAPSRRPPSPVAGAPQRPDCAADVGLDVRDDAPSQQSPEQARAHLVHHVYEELRRWGYPPEPEDAYPSEAEFRALLADAFPEAEYLELSCEAYPCVGTLTIDGTPDDLHDRLDGTPWEDSFRLITEGRVVDSELYDATIMAFALHSSPLNEAERIHVMHRVRRFRDTHGIEAWQWLEQ